MGLMGMLIFAGLQSRFQSMLSSFLFRTTMYGSCKAVHNDLLRADLNIIVNLCSILLENDFVMRFTVATVCRLLIFVSYLLRRLF